MFLKRSDKNMIFVCFLSYRRASSFECADTLIKMGAGLPSF